MKKVYIIVGSNNFWYTMCNSKKGAIDEANKLMSGDTETIYGDQESGHVPNPPEELFIYKAEEIKRISHEDYE